MNYPCPVCGKLYAVRPEHVGRKIGCKQCGGRLLVTASGLRAEPPSPPPPFPPAGSTVYTYQPPPPLPPPPPPEMDMGYDEPPPRRRRARGGNPVVDFLTFRLMLTPILIQIFFWVGTISCVVTGIGAMAGSVGSRPALTSDEDDRPAAKAAAGSRATFSVFQFASGLGMLVFGPLFLRLLCEEGIILFKIHEELREQTDRARR